MEGGGHLDSAVAPSNSEVGAAQTSYPNRDGMIVISDSEDGGDTAFSTASMPSPSKTRPQGRPKHTRRSTLPRTRSSSLPAMDFREVGSDQDLGTPLAESNLIKQTEDLLQQRGLLLAEKRKWESWLATQGRLDDNHDVA